MALVQLITTGRMEKEALGVSLARLFPGHDFRCPEPLDGFTSAPLPPDPRTSRTPLNLDRFVTRLVAAFDPGNRHDRPRPDFVLGIDDVELCNADDPSRIVASLRHAIEQKLASWPGGSRTVEGIREALATKVSFHLMAPMTEALFFADAGRSPARPPPRPITSIASTRPHATSRRSRSMIPTTSTPRPIPTPAGARKATARAIPSATSSI